MSKKDEMQTFVEVARTGTLVEAARKLSLAAPTVTKQINTLEERLGVRLLNRTTRKVALTEAGEIYFQSCKSMPMAEAAWHEPGRMKMETGRSGNRQCR